MHSTFCSFSAELLAQFPISNVSDFFRTEETKNEQHSLQVIPNEIIFRYPVEFKTQQRKGLKKPP